MDGELSGMCSLDLLDDQLHRHVSFICPSVLQWRQITVNLIFAKFSITRTNPGIDCFHCTIFIFKPFQFVTNWQYISTELHAALVYGGLFPVEKLYKWEPLTQFIPNSRSIRYKIKVVIQNPWHYHAVCRIPKWMQKRILTSGVQAKAYICHQATWPPNN